MKFVHCFDAALVKSNNMLADNHYFDSEFSIEIGLFGSKNVLQAPKQKFKSTFNSCRAILYFAYLLSCGAFGVIYDGASKSNNMNSAPSTCQYPITMNIFKILWIGKGNGAVWMCGGNHAVSASKWKKWAFSNFVIILMMLIHWNSKPPKLNRIHLPFECNGWKL